MSTRLLASNNTNNDYAWMVCNARYTAYLVRQLGTSDELYFIAKGYTYAETPEDL